MRTPYAFLGAAVCVAVLSLISFAAAFIFAITAIFFFFPLRVAVILSAVYLLFQFYSIHTAWVLNIKYSGKSVTLVTSKGWLKESADFQIPEGVEIGDLLWGGFERRVDHGRMSPRLVYTPAGEVKKFRVPLISSLLKLRKTETSRMITRSGGQIHTTPAHIFAMREQIPDRLQDEYVITGLAHLLAMSGFHVGIFTAGIFLLFMWLPLRLRAIPAIIILPLLLPLSGFAVTVVRAVVLAVAYMGAWLFGLKVANVRFLAFLAACMIFLYPFSLYSVSFLMSFFAVLGIMVMFKKRYTLAKGIFTMGIASTVFTLPVQLYFFGTSNVMSVITTVIFTPIVWAQMLFGLASLALGDIMIAPLVYIERFSGWLMGKTAAVSWYFMFVSKPSDIILIIAFAAAMILIFTRFRLASAAIFLLPLLPVYPTNVIYFPVLPPSPKGYIISSDEGTEIFYQGMRSTFVYSMVPAAAELGIRTFDRGIIRIFDGENLYLRIKEDGLSGTVCVNAVSGGCPYVYMTRSNTLKAPLDESVNKYVIYSNKYEDPKILIQSQIGRVMLDYPTGCGDSGVYESDADQGK